MMAGFRARIIFPALAALSLLVSPAMAQVTTVDPNDAIDADLAGPSYTPPTEAPYDGPEMAANSPLSGDVNADLIQGDTGVTANKPFESLPATNSVDEATTYQEDDLIGAAEGVFGKGAKGLAGLIEDLLAKQGRPNGYITGREASGAFVVGLRYGSGKLHHKVEGERTVYWTGPSVGFDIGGNASNTFVLVYNLYDSQELFQRFPAGEGAAYFIGGFHVSYLRSGDKVLIPVRLGAGLRLGANVGYLKFTESQRWLPF